MLAPPEGSAVAEILKEVREKVPLSGLEIGGMRTRRGINGACLVEIYGEGRGEKAAILADRITAAVGYRGVRVSRPVKSADLRLRGLDESVSPVEVAATLAETGGCSAADVRVGEIRTSPAGRGTVWVRCPVEDARAIVRAKRVRIGWSSAAVELLRERPIQCYRCLAYGHVRQGCTAEVDRADLCYRCGSPGHVAARCASAPKCPLCAGLGRGDAHRLSGKGCIPPPTRGGPWGRARGAAAPASAGGPVPRAPRAEVGSSCEGPASGPSPGSPGGMDVE